MYLLLAFASSSVKELSSFHFLLQKPPSSSMVQLQCRLRFYFAVEFLLCQVWQLLYEDLPSHMQCSKFFKAAMLFGYIVGLVFSLLWNSFSANFDNFCMKFSSFIYSASLFIEEMMT